MNTSFSQFEEVRMLRTKNLDLLVHLDHLGGHIKHTFPAVLFLNSEFFIFLMMDILEMRLQIGVSYVSFFDGIFQFLQHRDFLSK